MVATRCKSRGVLAAAFVIAWYAGTASAQPTPSPAAVAMAKEVITLKGATGLWDPIVPGVVEQAKNAFLQMNPMLSRDLNEVSARLRSEFAPRKNQLTDEVARLYAARFTEQELKDVLAFYKTPAGRKVIIEEPKILDASMSHAQDWANKLSEEVLNKFRAEMKKKGHDL
jgi:uncharacterized protein